jgi:hypothetical protein
MDSFHYETAWNIAVALQKVFVELDRVELLPQAKI